MGKNASIWLALKPTALLLLLTGCAVNSLPSSPPSVAPPLVPNLPQQALQPNPPLICLPTCSAGAEKLFSRWRDSLTPHTRRGSPVNAQPKR